MSKFLTAAAVTEFDSEVKHAYQSMGKLRNTVTVRTGVVGEAYKFARMGQGIANQKASQADVTPMDVAHARQTANLENWNAPEYTDIFDQSEVNYDEKQELAQTIAKTIAKALTRREDQIIIDAIGAADFQASPANLDQALDLTTATAGLSVGELRTASTSLTDRGVDAADRYIACSAAALNSLLGETEVTSSDYNTVKALVQGELDTFLGFKHKASIGYAVGIDAKTTIDWVPQKTSWLANGMLKAGAVVREAAGIVRMTTTS
jgi:hypothetical protein